MKHDRKKNIFIVFTDLSLGGVQQKIVDIVNYGKQSKKYKDIVYHLVIRKPSTFSFAEKLPPSFRFLHMAPSSVFEKSGILFIFYIGWLILKYNPSSVIVFLHQYAFFMALLKKVFFWKKFRFVIGQDNILSFDNTKANSKRKYPKKIITYAYSLSDRIITQTNIAKNDMVAKYSIPREKIVVIPNWTLHKTLIARKARFDIIFCGRFMKQKRLDRFLKIVFLVKKKIPNIRVCILGEGEKRQMMDKMIANLDLYKNIQIFSPTHEIASFLTESKILVLSSDFEGHPLVLLEAMVQKTVPVVYQYPGVKEYLDDGKTGYIEKTIQKMADKIIFLLHHEKIRNSVAKRAQKEVLQKFNHKLIDQVFQVIIG